MAGVDRSRPPGLGPEPSFTFPEIRRRTLENGLRVWTVEHREVPLVSTLLLIPAGASADPSDRAGLAALTGDLLDEGCGALDALGLHDALGRIGAQLETEVGPDATLVAITSLERFAGRALELLADMALRPRLERADFERVRDLRLHRLVQMRDLPPALAERAFAEALYGSHPYGHLSIGSEVSLQGITRDHVLAFHSRHYDPRHATVIAIGDATHDELFAHLRRVFDTWNPGGSDSPVVNVPPPPPDGARRLVVIHRPGAAQSELRIGHVSVPRRTPDYHALLVMNMILGGQFVSRINLNLRENKGYTYGARTGFEFRRGAGPFVLQASVQSDATVEAIRESLSELEGIRGTRPVTAEELELGRAALTRGYPRTFETADQIGRGVAQLALYDLPDDYFTTFVPAVLKLTADDITRVAARHVNPERLTLVVVGDREKVGPSLDQLGFD
ncbi:MAG TPA: pitrilysin family protein [Vicinamibacterales bacterium]|nr:pitrilysin family protein [Vicinamibacterales bacterium]